MVGKPLMKRNNTKSVRFITLILGGLFIWAGGAKWSEWESLAGQWRMVDLGPDFLAVGFAHWLPSWEILLGMGLLSGVWRLAHLWGSLLTLLAFTLVLGYGWVSGTIWHCSCFGDIMKMTPPWAIARNLIFSGLAILALYLEKNQAILQNKPAREKEKGGP